jgi:effector-binding domain-containing protein
MTSKLPFFMFFMTKMMTAYIGMDYERGLKMLKDYVETGSVPSKLSFRGIQSYAGCMYVGIRATCTMDSLSQKMADDFAKLSAWAKENASVIVGEGFSIYHTWDVLKNKAEYTAAFPVKEAQGQLPPSLINESIPATKVNIIAHTGAYQHLGNAWTTQYMMQRNKEFKFRKGIDPFEVYKNMPGQVSTEQLLTEIHFPAVG